jgi:hypothetical protein
MRNNTRCNIGHAIIETQHVFSEDNQVFIKQVVVSGGEITADKWFPIPFQWAPVWR